MWLEDYSPDLDSSEWNSQSWEAIKEITEKYKEATKKAWKKVAKVSKDEKKAKKYDILLAWFMVKIIIDKKYDFLLDEVFNCIESGYWSNFVLWILSLINDEISNKIRDISNKNHIKFDYEIKKEMVEFDDHNINEKIKERINFWVEDITDSVIIEYSSIQTLKLKELIKNDREILLIYTKKIFSFFLSELNIKISENKAESITDFILSEVSKSINKLEVEII